MKNTFSLGLNLSECLLALTVVSVVATVSVCSVLNINNAPQSEKFLVSFTDSIESIFKQQTTENGLIPRELTPSSILDSKLNYRSSSVISNSADLPLGCNIALPVTQYSFSNKKQFVFASQNWSTQANREDTSQVCAQYGPGVSVITVNRNGKSNAVAYNATSEDIATSETSSPGIVVATVATLISQLSTATKVSIMPSFVDATTGLPAEIFTFDLTAQCTNGTNYTFSSHPSIEESLSYEMYSRYGDLESQREVYNTQISSIDTQIAETTAQLAAVVVPEPVSCNGIPQTISNYPGPGYRTNPAYSNCMSLYIQTSNQKQAAQLLKSQLTNRIYMLNQQKNGVGSGLYTITMKYAEYASRCNNAGGTNCTTVKPVAFTPPQIKLDDGTTCSIQASNLNNVAGSASALPHYTSSNPLSINTSDESTAQLEVY